MAARTPTVASGRPDVSGRGRGTGHTTAQERFDRRIRARRRRYWGLAGVLALVLALGAGLWWALWRSDLLLVERVVVTGVEERWQEQVLDAAAVPMSQPMVEVDVAAATGRVGELPVVREVRVVRSWPTTITIEVTPRVPVLAAVQPDRRVALVDEEGVTIETVATAPEGLPTVRAAGESGSSAEAYRAAWQVMAALPSGLAPQVTAATVSSADLVTLALGERTVVWGGPEEAELKASVVEALLGSGATYIDVSAPRSPVTRVDEES